MTEIKKIVGINLLILLAYNLAIYFQFSNQSEPSLGIGLVSIVAVGMHVVANFILSMGWFISKNNNLGKAYLLSTGVVLMVGFSACLGSMTLADY